MALENLETLEEDLLRPWFDDGEKAGFELAEL
jgi:hypothetical protein